MSWSAENPRYCSGCRKATCVCEWIQSFAPELEFHFLVPMSEQIRARTTSWLSHRMLLNSTFQEPDSSVAFGSDTAILYPSKSAVPWSEMPALKRVIIPDDTWDKTRAMLRGIPALSSLPHICLERQYEGINEVRRPPAPGALCTAEAVGRLLLETGELRGDRLLDLIEKLNRREASFRHSHKPADS